MSFPGAPTLVLVQTTSLSLKDASPTSRHFSFKSATTDDPSPNRIVPPSQGGANDPTSGGGMLVVYNSAGLSNDEVTVNLPAVNWTLLGSTGYQYKDPSPSSVISKVSLKTDRITVKGGKGWTYTLDEAGQGRVAVRLLLGSQGWCADGPAKTSGSPPSSARNDTVGRFKAASHAAAPGACPLTP